MTHSPFRSMRAVTAAVLLTLASCKKDSGPSSDNQVTSLLFDAASPEAREALATPVNFRLTDANYAQWEQAQRFLDALPRSRRARAPERRSSGPGSPSGISFWRLSHWPRRRKPEQVNPPEV